MQCVVEKLTADDLATTRLFAGAPAAALDLLAQRGRLQRFRSGTNLFEFGDPPGSLFLVRKGRVEVLVPSAAEPVNEVGPGGVVGELSLILHEPRTATVRATTAVTAWTIAGGDFAVVVESHPDLAVLLSREISRRLVSTTHRMAPAGVTTLTAVLGDATPVAAAVVAAGGGRVGVAALAGAPPQSRVPRAVTAVDDAEALVAGWGGARVAGLDHLVVAAGSVPLAATRALLNAAADVVADEPPEWLAPLGLRARSLPAGPAVTDLRRTGRVIAGRATGLVLSSGGSKTVAHIGTITAVQAAGIDVDFVAGSSGGSLFAAGLAFGHSPAVMLEHTRVFAALSGLRRLDYAKLPRSGLIRGVRIHEHLRQWFAGLRIEDAPIPLRVVAADVETGAEVVIDRGDVADALRASMSIPGAFEPWKIDGRWLIDGAIVDPLPAAPLRAAGAGYVIASNVAGQENLRATGDGKAPGIVQILGRVVNASERELLRNVEGLVDVMIRPVVRASGPLDFSGIDDMIKAGQLAGEEALAAARR